MYWAVCCGVIMAAGLAVNGFITLVNITEWLREGRLKLCDKVLTILCLTRFFLLWIFFLEMIGVLLQLIPFSAFGIYCIFYVFELSLDYFSRWVAMWLSVLYFVMITISKQPFMLSLRSKIPSITRSMLWVSILLSFFPALTYSLTEKDFPCVQNPDTNISANGTSGFPRPFLLTSFFFGHCVPYMMEMVSSVYLLCTLFVHVKHTETKVSSFSTPNMAAHWSVIQYIFVLNFMSMCNFVANIFIWFWISDRDTLAVLYNSLFISSLAFNRFHPEQFKAEKRNSKNTPLFKNIVLPQERTI
ncbi:bitter taste receptor 7 [Xenopus tropicalis]|uniref:Taste receptor type 2 n=1 Tax=Xenopus tropicalis TaxID=8364 RepID=Q2AB74_XENTR|nr:bitter taste receptor 7 [Xenopus tropicalis]BAE80393.1 bitter taste receptor [Xenopus tropicalis]|eukprot:NP_001165470.1 bitter taste receptor 7 [Xenopus tropicalis]